MNLAAATVLAVMTQAVMTQAAMTQAAMKAAAMNLVAQVVQAVMVPVRDAAAEDMPPVSILKVTSTRKAVITASVVRVADFPVVAYVMYRAASVTAIVRVARAIRRLQVLRAVDQPGRRKVSRKLSWVA
jgi:hypothetical protein